MFKYFLGIFILLVSSIAHGQNVKTFIPVKAFTYLPTVKTEATRIMPQFDTPWYFGSLVEHESCISLKHSRCWSPTSQLLSKRERGAGLSMLTIAYNTDGSTRFDSLTDLRRANMLELKELSWSNILERPDLQIRSLVLMTRSNYNIFHEVNSKLQRLAMTDQAYNAGAGRVKKNRLKCSLEKDCDPNIWFGNVENYCTASTKPLYAGRSACDIAKEHVTDVLLTRMPKYKPYFIDTR